MHKETKWLTLGFALIAVAAACSSSSSNGTGTTPGAGGETTSTGSGSVDDYCAQSCEKSHSCDKKIDVQTCSNDCANTFAATGPKLRSDFVDSITQCFTGNDCVTVLGGDALDTCTSEAVAELAPSKVGTSFCTDYQAAVEKCNGDFNKADCYNKAKTFNDASLKKAEACLSKTCSDIDDCVTATLGVVGGGSDNTTTGTGGTSSGTGGTGSGTAGTSNPGDAGAPPTAGTGSGTLFTGACTADSPAQCASATTINACDDNGQYAVQSCKTLLSASGFSGSQCSADTCQIVSALDAKCQQGVVNVCSCETCSDADKVNLYINCFTDTPAGDQAAVYCAADASACTDVEACAPAP